MPPALPPRQAGRCRKNAFHDTRHACRLPYECVDRERCDDENAHRVSNGNPLCVITLGKVVLRRRRVACCQV
eukprot:350941-Chlamydomonas_euryale.AAC.11